MKFIGMEEMTPERVLAGVGRCEGALAVVRLSNLKSFAGSLVVISFALCTAYTAPVAADTGFWNSFQSSSTPRWDQPFDRLTAREWEANPARGYPTISKKNISTMRTAIKRYKKIASKGGWKKIPSVKLESGSRHDAVVLLRRRLALTGDLRQGSSQSRAFDYHVERAVKHFQVRHGLTPTGKIDRVTLAALNVSAKSRLRQLTINLSRLRTHAASAKRRYVMVNIPAAQIEAVDKDTVVTRHAAVVGKVDRRTPVLKSRIHEINFNPYWTIPASIVRKDLVPKARRLAKRGKDILATYKIHAFNADGRKINPKKINWNSSSVYNYRYRQDPWVDNSMGFVKINFHNQYSVYMHDTPSKSLFGRNYRAQSSGCVRVKHVKTLVNWLLRDNGNWSSKRTNSLEKSGKRQDVRLKKPVPVYFVYMTAWADPKGMVHFRRDLYRRDGVGKQAAVY